jgi:hypothetical protein
MPIVPIIPTTYIKNFGTDRSCRNTNYQPIARLVLVVCIMLIVLPVSGIFYLLKILVTIIIISGISNT